MSASQRLWVSPERVHWLVVAVVRRRLHKCASAPNGMVATNSHRRPLFPLGHIVATPGALAALATGGDSAHELIMRHACGDFGTVCPEDWKANEDAIAQDARVFSAYLLRDSTKVWVITEADRSATTLLLPDDY